MDISFWAWLAVIAAVLVLLAIDLVMHRDAHDISVREATVWSIVWVVIGLGMGGVIWWGFGADFGLQYYAGYLIEKSLAIDNVFVWAIIFCTFAVPKPYQHRVFFLGVVGALAFRAVFIAAGSALIASAAWVPYIFGALLVVTGIKMIRQRTTHMDPSRARALALFRRYVPSTDAYHRQRLWIRANGAFVATPLLAVLVMVEATDLVFAVDSIPAVFAVTSEPFLVFTSNAFAILGLRAMYFVLADLMHRIVYLKVGLACVLIWVGVKMVIGHALVVIPTLVSLAIILSILTTAIVASLIRTRRGGGVDPGVNQPTDDVLGHASGAKNAVTASDDT